MIGRESPDGQPAPDTSPIHRLIRRTLALLRSSWVATGLGLTVGLALGTLVAAAAVDLVLPLGSALRLAALVLVVVPAAWAFIVGVVAPAFRRMRPGVVARRIETHLPGIHNRLVSCIDLEKSEQKDRLSPEFVRRLVHETLERIKGFRPSLVVDWPSLRRAGVFAAVSIGAFVLAFLLLSDRFPTALARIFSPFADIPPASGVVYAVEPGDAKVLRGDDVTIAARVEKGRPERLRLEWKADGTSEALWYDLKPRDAGRWAFTLTGVGLDTDRGAAGRAYRYRIHGGGTWSRWNRITVVDRPLIAGLRTVLHYPGYMGLPEPRVGPPQTADVTGPEGSQVEVLVQAEGDVTEGEIQLLAARTKRVEVKDRPERVWFQEQLPAGAAAEGNWQWTFHKLLARPVHTEPPAGGVHGHQFHNAKPFSVRAGESLFAMVFIPADQKPEAILLQWHDGTNWEHRAYWGDDKIPAGQPGTPSRRQIGPLPPAGEWVRLEVPAALVDLEGKDVRGMGFVLSGGQGLWHRAGSVPSSHVEEKELIVATTFPVLSAGPGQWSGRFPLDHDALYRVELRNELGHPNKPMTPGKAVAIPDSPPQVVLERPGADLVLSEPGKVPLAIAAFDDYGLADVVIAVQKGDSGGFIGRPVRRYDKPLRSENLATSLDLAALGLKLGEHLRYRVEARDRKGQSAQTKEYVIRIAADPNAADKALADFEKNQDTFRENLTKLIAEQAKVREGIKAMAAQYKPLEQAIEAAKAEVRPAPEGAPQPDPAKPPPLDPEAAKQLAALRQELGRLGGEEEKTAQMAQQVSSALTQAVQQAGNLQMLPPQILEPMKGVERAFQEMALQPMKNLAAEMKQGAAPNQEAPALDPLGQKGDRLQQDLEALRDRLEALADARKGVREDLNEALAELRRDLLGQDAGMSARDLAELRDFLKARAEELQRLGGQQEELAEFTPQAPELLLPDLAKRQDLLEGEEERALADARQLLDAEKNRRMRGRDPEFPAAPYTPEGEEEMVPPKEQDTDEPLPKGGADDPADAKKGDAAQEEADADEEPLFQPALGGPRPKLDPRFAEKARPLPPQKADAQGKDSSRARREELAARQQQKLREMESARQSLASDGRTLDAMLEQLRQALSAEDSEAAQGLLDRLMQDPTMRQALAMAARRQQMLAQAATPARPGQPPQPSPANAAGASPAPRATAFAPAPEAALADLDLETRTVLLKMQPKLREELLQGLREEGPEGYRAFIRDYFRRLTKVKNAP